MDIEELDKIISQDYQNITGLIVESGKRRVLERYYNNYHPNSSIHIASVTKSIMSLLIGIAIDKGHIESVDQRVLDFYPDYTLKRGEKTLQKIKIKHLLTMTAPYKYKYEPYTRVYSSTDWELEILHLLGGRKDIGSFKYTTVGLHILSGILSKAVGVSTLEFARENLFTPLGIRVTANINLETREDHLTFLKHSNQSGWITDPLGINTAGWGLTLKTEDLMKIGKLVLQKGYWQDRKIISPSWLDLSSTTHSKCGELSYGYLWWIINEQNGTFAAIGDGGNVIYINREKDMVVAITSSFYPWAKDRIEFIEKLLVPNDQFTSD